MVDAFNVLNRKSAVYIQEQFSNVYVSSSCCNVRDRRQISLVMVREFKQIN